jgi:hypothetical protein
MVKMKEEQDFLFLAALIAFGITICSALVCIFQGQFGLISGVPLVFVGCLFFPLMYKSNNDKVSNFNEKLEKIMFFATIIIIAISFLYIYRIM